MDKKLKVKTAIEIVGIPFGVKNEGGLLNVVTHELSIECLPADIPHSIPVDVNELHLHASIRVSDLKVDEKVRVLDASDRVIAHVAVPKAEEVVAPAATAEAAPTAAEPEVIKKGKKEEEGAEGAEKAAKPGEKAAKPEKAEKKEKK